jgi:hypothetical protein
MRDTLPSGAARLPQWAAPFGFRWFAPLLLIALLAVNLGVITLRWHAGSAVASRLMWLWIPGVIGAVLLCISWRALLRIRVRAQRT